MGFSLRAAREQDAAALVELLNSIIETGKYSILDQPFSVANQLAFIRGFPHRGVYNVAVCNDSHKVIGMQDVLPISTEVSALQHVGEISTFVSLAERRTGIGQTLSQTTFQQARERGFSKIMATIRADNPAAVAFYKSQGFQLIGTAHKHAFLHGVYIDEILMERFVDAI